MPIGELELTDRIDPKAEKVLCDGCIANALAKNAPPYHVSKLNDKEFVVKPDFPIGFTRTKIHEAQTQHEGHSPWGRMGRQEKFG